ncbi:MAG: MarR family transcriptional regulator [Anaerolineaceae bacterium]|nr:MarR family transcriptional regulator [Anaerolineaceae bacterium]
METIKHQETSAQVLCLLPLLIQALRSNIEAHKTMRINHFFVLRTLMEQPMSLKTLADQQSLTAATMCSNINTLEKRGWVTRSRNKDDKRTVVITLTDEGLQALMETNADALQAMEKVIAHLSPEEKEHVGVGAEVLSNALMAFNHGVY